jgi:hypothetical protein
MSGIQTRPSGIGEPLKQNDDECEALRYGLHSKIYKVQRMNSANLADLMLSSTRRFWKHGTSNSEVPDSLTYGSTRRRDFGMHAFGPSTNLIA